MKKIKWRPFLVFHHTSWRCNAYAHARAVLLVAVASISQSYFSKLIRTLLSRIKAKLEGAAGSLGLTKQLAFFRNKGHRRQCRSCELFLAACNYARDDAEIAGYYFIGHAGVLGNAKWPTNVVGKPWSAMAGRELH